MSVLYKDLNLTVFPEAVDDFIQWLDITAQDGPLIKQYTDAMQLGNIALANEILSQIPSGTKKIIKANDLNKLTQAMLAVERFYKSDIQSYISKKQTEWQLLINQFDYKGNWTSGTTYVKNNMVSYVIFGMSYIYIALDTVPVGTPPTDTKHWRVYTVQGKQGISGEGVSYRQQWKVENFYSLNDVVTYDGALWQAIKPSQGNIPSQSSEFWKIVMSLSSVSYPIQNTQPNNQEIGDLWFNTQGNPTQYYYLHPLQNPATDKDISSGKEAYNEHGEIIVGSKV